MSPRSVSPPPSPSAPTHKAAKAMRESSGTTFDEVRTVHRFLGLLPGVTRWNEYDQDMLLELKRQYEESPTNALKIAIENNE